MPTTKSPPQKMYAVLKLITTLDVPGNTPGQMTTATAITEDITGMILVFDNHNKALEFAENGRYGIIEMELIHLSNNLLN